VEDGGKGHTRVGCVGSVTVAELRILILEAASVMSVRSKSRPKIKDWTA